VDEGIGEGTLSASNLSEKLKRRAGLIFKRYDITFAADTWMPLSGLRACALPQRQ
jgi:hypothetical protein